ncbi:MerR family transcriptional regulator [Microbispora amethystogenes]|uniref:MerR family transcriptional regulator n=1 Tax=Microbispora amethystogenes TaxID=1427754 RepID=UPI0033F57803
MARSAGANPVGATSPKPSAPPRAGGFVVKRTGGHRRYRDEDLDVIEVLACLRAVGMGIEAMRTYLANRTRGRAAAAEQRDLLPRQAERIEARSPLSGRCSATCVTRRLCGTPRPGRRRR